MFLYQYFFLLRTKLYYKMTCWYNNKKSQTVFKIASFSMWGSLFCALGCFITLYKRPIVIIIIDERLLRTQSIKNQVKISDRRIFRTLLLLIYIRIYNTFILYLYWVFAISAVCNICISPDLQDGFNRKIQY